MDSAQKQPPQVLGFASALGGLLFLLTAIMFWAVPDGRANYHYYTAPMGVVSFFGIAMQALLWFRMRFGFDYFIVMSLYALILWISSVVMIALIFDGDIGFFDPPAGANDDGELFVNLISAGVLLASFNIVVWGGLTGAAFAMAK